MAMMIKWKSNINKNKCDFQFGKQSVLRFSNNMLKMGSTVAFTSKFCLNYHRQLKDWPLCWCAYRYFPLYCVNRFLIPQMTYLQISIIFKKHLLKRDCEPKPIHLRQIIHSKINQVLAMKSRWADISFTWDFFLNFLSMEFGWDGLTNFSS